MKKRNREINIFNLSMLDVISGAMAAFLIIMVVLMPFYNKTTIDLTDQVGRLEAELAQAQVDAAEARRDAQQAQRERDASERKLGEARERISSLERKDLDLMLVMDTTGSMSDEIADLQKNLKGILRLLRELTNSLRVGFVAYRDAGEDEEYLVRQFPLATMDDGGFVRLQGFIDRLAANGGGDTPEAVDKGLERALAAPWAEASKGIILVIGDAPVHPAKVDHTLGQARGFAARQPRYRLSSISAGGAADYFRQLANAGNGSFIADNGEMYESILLSVIQSDSE